MEPRTGTKSIHSVYDQTFSLYLADGTQTTFTIQDLDYWYLEAIFSCIEYATQLGASCMLLILLFLLTKSKKRTNALYILNSIALVFNIFRMLLVCCYFTGPFNEIYNYLSGDLSSLPKSAYGISIAASLFTVLLVIVINTSLLMQIQVVCITLRKKHRQALLISSSFIAGGTAASKIYLTAINIRQILNPLASTVMLRNIHKITNIIMTVTIFWFSAIFVAKLGYALYQRRKLGLRRWGSMQVIFTMGCQTLVIPAIFSVVQHLVNFPAIGSFELTLVALFLPLSSLWAAHTVDGSTRPTPGFDAQQRNFPTYHAPMSETSRHLSVTLSGSDNCTNDDCSPVNLKSEKAQDLV